MSIYIILQPLFDVAIYMQRIISSGISRNTSRNRDTSRNKMLNNWSQRLEGRDQCVLITVLPLSFLSHDS